MYITICKPDDQCKFNAQSRALKVSALLHVSNLHWSSVSHIVTYMFQCYCLISSHPHLLPHSPKVCSLHLCLFCCFAYRIVIIIFLGYMAVLFPVLSTSLELTQMHSFLQLVILHCVYVPQCSYPFIS